MIDIRPARPEDLAPLTALYNYYIEQTPITFDLEPYTPEGRRPWFDQFAETGRHRLLVATQGDALLGYAGCHGFRSKAAYDPSIETTIYLAHDAVGKGLGVRLYEALFEALEGEDVHRAYAGVTLPNDASLALHERFGFEEVGCFREVGRKFDRYWDVVWLERAL